MGSGFKVFLTAIAVSYQMFVTNAEFSSRSNFDTKTETTTTVYNNILSTLSINDKISSFINQRNLNLNKHDIPGAIGSGDGMKKVLSKTCSHRYTFTCLKLDVVSLVDKLSEADKYQLMPGVAVIKDNSSENDESSRKFPGDLVASLAKDYPNDIDARLDAFLLRRIGKYLNSHTLTFKLIDDESYAKALQFEKEAVEQVENSDYGIETGRKKGKKGMGQLLLAALMMKGTLLPIALGGLAMLAGKALMTGMLALMLSAIVGLKSLTSGGGGKQAVTYEIVQKPVYSHSHSQSHELHHEHGGGGGGGGGGGYGHSSYGRSFDVGTDSSFQPELNAQTLQNQNEYIKQLDAQQIAYSAYIPTPFSNEAKPSHSR
ncbi:hypothetical protein L9F63_006367 [Diploptera punctata]|uniref:Osiris 7 n=1 Tax=Diploptera punctata TaxID=6984 RepID=A0AAD7ZB60_DIPPU|nr:hypothetical protein L9F63_006367 [Diploptera punctata]